MKSDQHKKVLFDNVRMDTSWKSAAARIDDLWRQWYEVRANNQVQHEFATVKGKKIFRTQMAAKLFPDKVRSRVQAKLEDVDQLAQEIRDDDKKFYDYVRGVAEEVERVFLTQIDHPKRERSDTLGNDPGNNRPFKKRRLYNQPPGGNQNNSGGRSQFFGNRFGKYRKGNFFRNGHSQKPSANGDSAKGKIAGSAPESKEAVKEHFVGYKCGEPGHYANACPKQRE